MGVFEFVVWMVMKEVSVYDSRQLMRYCVICSC
jgi:hypothetical protein